MKHLPLIFLALSLTGCASHDAFQRRYDHYFPSHSEYVDSVYRRCYDKWLFGVPPLRVGPEPGTEHLWQLYHAFHGDAAAVHLFSHNPDRDADGEHSEAWVYDCVLLLLRLGDDRFSDLLAHEDQKTREKVGWAIDPQIDFQRDPFPKTRALYHFRWKPSPNPNASPHVPTEGTR